MDQLKDNFKQLEKKTRDEARQIYKNGSRSHAWDHVERVYTLAVHIGEREGADLHVLKLAAILHDIGREAETKSNGGICHAACGAEMAAEVLRKHTHNEDLIKAVTHCIATHRFRGKNKPQTLEARVLFDADKLDSIGAVGIGRSFLFAGEIGARLHNSQVDILQTKPYSIEDTAFREFSVKLKMVHSRMLTSEGKRLARGRHRFMVNFFKRLHEETNGLK
jgi:uncharacterized protein